MNEKPKTIKKKLKKPKAVNEKQKPYVKKKNRGKKTE